MCTPFNFVSITLGEAAHDDEVENTAKLGIFRPSRATQKTDQDEI